MAHPRRAELVDGLLERLDRPAEVAWDERGVEWDTGRRAWLAHDPDATHHLVVQDDAVVCADLCAGLEAALAHQPDALVGLYVGRVRPYASRIERAVAQADEWHRSVSWLGMPKLLWGVAVAMPVDAIRDAVKATDRLHPRVAEYDRLLSVWALRRGMRIRYTWPSLVDHAPVPSLLGHGPGLGHGDGRVAHRFAGTDTSALALDWAGGTLVVEQRARTQFPRPVSARPSVSDRRDPDTVKP